MLNYFQLFLDESRESQCKIWKGKQAKTLLRENVPEDRVESRKYGTRFKNQFPSSFAERWAHDELINVIYLLCSDLLLFSRKFAKIVRDANRYKMVDIIAPSINTRTSLLKSAKASSLFFLSDIYVGGIGKLFRPTTRIFRLILNSRRVFKNHQYFMILKFNFGAFFQDTFFLCGITPNHLRLMSWLVERFFFSRI